MSTGIVFGSVFTTRRPSTRIKVRCEPKPRRPIEEPPVPPALLTCGLTTPPVTEGSSCTRSPTVSAPVALISCASMTTTGLEVSRSTRRMLEPVTTTVCSVCAFWVLGWLAASWLPVSWAKAVPEAPTAMTAPSETARRTAEESFWTPSFITTPSELIFVMGLHRSAQKYNPTCSQTDGFRTHELPIRADTNRQITLCEPTSYTWRSVVIQPLLNRLARPLRHFGREKRRGGPMLQYSIGPPREAGAGRATARPAVPQKGRTCSADGLGVAGYVLCSDGHSWRGRHDANGLGNRRGLRPVAVLPGTEQHRRHADHGEDRRRNVHGRSQARRIAAIHRSPAGQPQPFCRDRALPGGGRAAVVPGQAGAGTGLRVLPDHHRHAQPDQRQRQQGELRHPEKLPPGPRAGRGGRTVHDARDRHPQYLRRRRAGGVRGHPHDRRRRRTRGDPRAVAGSRQPHLRLHAAARPLLHSRACQEEERSQRQPVHRDAGFGTGHQADPALLPRRDRPGGQGARLRAGRRSPVRLRRQAGQGRPAGAVGLRQLRRGPGRAGPVPRVRRAARGVRRKRGRTDGSPDEHHRHGECRRRRRNPGPGGRGARTGVLRPPRCAAQNPYERNPPSTASTWPVT